MTKSRLLLAVLLAISLAACGRESPGPVLTAPSRLEIRTKLARVCGKPLTDTQLERAARVVEKYAQDPDVIGAIGDLDASDQVNRICRGLKGTSK